jgi:hypothetical protein
MDMKFYSVNLMGRKHFGDKGENGNIKTDHEYVGFEVFAAVVMKSIIFWDMTPCSPLCSNRRFGGT